MQHEHPTTLPYQGTTLHLLDFDGRQWLEAAQLAECLRLPDAGAVEAVYQDHPTFFGGTSCLMAQTYPDQTRHVRAFTLHGAYKLASLTLTPAGAAFQAWLCDLLWPVTPPAVNYNDPEVRVRRVFGVLTLYIDLIATQTGELSVGAEHLRDALWLMADELDSAARDWRSTENRLRADLAASQALAAAKVQPPTPAHA